MDHLFWDDDDYFWYDQKWEVWDWCWEYDPYYDVEYKAYWFYGYCYGEYEARYYERRGFVVCEPKGCYW